MKFGCIYFCTQRFIQGKDESVHESDKEAVTLLWCGGACGSASFLCLKRHWKYQLQDINYQLAMQEDQTAIFEEWCSFLNFFDSSIRFELSFMNMSTDAADFEKMIRIPFRKDAFNHIRSEFSSMLKKQLAQGNNGLTKTKYLTFGIEADSMKLAKPRLQHVETDLLNNFRRLGVRAKTLNGKERLHLMHSMFHISSCCFSCKVQP